MRKAVQKILIGIMPSLIPVVGFCATPVDAVAIHDSALSLSDLDMYYEAQNIHQTLDFDQDDGLTLNLAGQNREKGVLHFYIRADESDYINHIDTIADQLNNIEPSVGVQFELDF